MREIHTILLAIVSCLSLLAARPVLGAAPPPPRDSAEVRAALAKAPKVPGGDRVRLRAALPGDFIDCVRQGRRTCAPVEIAHRSDNGPGSAQSNSPFGFDLTRSAPQPHQAFR